MQDIKEPEAVWRTMAGTTDGEEARSIATVIYAYSGGRGALVDDVAFALARLAEVSERVLIVHGSEVDQPTRSALAALASGTLQMADASFSPRWYAEAWRRFGGGSSDNDRIVLTGDSWFGPINPLHAVLERMAHEPADLWQMVENATGTRQVFPEEGFPDRVRPWAWVCLTGRLMASTDWSTCALVQEDEGQSSGSEWALNDYFTERGWRTTYAFPASNFPDADPALLHTALLLAEGAPFVDKAVFQGYPPHLNRLGIIGREVVEAIGDAGYPLAMLWSSLVRNTPPKALNTNAGMLEVIDPASGSTLETELLRVAVIARVTEVDAFDTLLFRLDHLPQSFDLFVTTTDGISAGRIDRHLESWWAGRPGRYDVRVTPASPGHDMADFFVACRDVLLSDAYDLIVKVHLREPKGKTMNVARYFRRYQFDNLLSDPASVRAVFELFAKEPGLGVVFPPMIHIGYATMGRGWAGLDAVATQLCQQLGITVPLDKVSPLAPYGGMFIARPAALRLLAAHPWSYAQYWAGERMGRPLNHVQERLVAAAAGERGFHVRTILTPEHAAIGHTSLEYKLDEMLSTTRGYPVEQIGLLHRAGYTGYGGPVALLRMYLRINHPRASELLRPVYRVAGLGFRVMRWAQSVVGRVSGASTKESM
jgi:lipopolysaccharide biosynthesis protein